MKPIRVMGNSVRAEFMWFIWRVRNAAVFHSVPPVLTILKSDLFFQMKEENASRKKELRRRKDFLRKGKHACKNIEVFHHRDGILYQRWEEELEDEIINLRAKDQQLIDQILEVTNLYTDVEKDEETVYPQRFPRPCVCHTFPCIHTLVIH